MPATPSAARHYPVTCPTCDVPGGYPYQVRTLPDQPGSIEVRLRCRDCSHEWVEVVKSE